MKDQNILHSLVHAAADHMIRSSEGAQVPDAVLLADRARELIARLDEAGQEQLASRLRIHRLLMGKDLAREVTAGETDTAKILRETETELEPLLTAMISSAPGDVAQATRMAIQGILSSERQEKIETLGRSPEELYQQVIGASFDDAKNAIAEPKAKKWIDLIHPVFVEGKALPLLDAFGCIPHQLYTAQKFQKTVHFGHLASLNRQLKEKEGSEKGDQRGRTLQASAQLLTHLFLSGVAKEAKGEVTLDVNGVYINLFKQPGKGEKPVRIARHLPYEYASEELLAAMTTQKRLTENDVLEVRLRRAEAQNDPIEQAHLEQEKVRRIALHLDLHETGASRSDPEWFNRKRICFDGLNQTDAHGQHLYMPLSKVRGLLDNTEEPDPRFHYHDSLVHVLSSVETIQEKISGDVMKKDGYKSYILSESAQKSYEMRTRILHDPRNYDVARIIGTLLEHRAERMEENKSEYRLFRGTIHGKEKDKNHSFLEIIAKRGSVERVLLDPKKQLSPRQRELFEQLPELNEREYRTFETLALTYTHFKRALEHTKESERRCVDVGIDFTDGWKAFMCEMNSFLVMEDPQRFSEAKRLSEAFNRQSKEDPGSSCPEWDYFHLCEIAIEEFGKKLFASQNPKDVVQPFLTRLHRDTVTFDGDCIRAFQEKFKDRSYAWDEDLCRQLEQIGHSIVVVRAEDRRKIPYHMEAEAIEALQLPRDRPLISLVGGCRHYDKGGKENLAVQLCDALLKTAQRVKANVSVPGTQSGIGNTIGRAVVIEQQRTVQLPANQKAAFFAVSPGGETFFPDRASPSNVIGKATYAIAPVNSLITPTVAGWDLKGERKRTAGYFEHLKYAEDVNNRLSFGQARVTVVSNGGLFTIADTNAALENTSAILLVQDTGRFADLAIVLEKNRNSLNGLSQSAWVAKVLRHIQHDVPEHSRTSLLREFGGDMPAKDADQEAEQKLYRDTLREYFILSDKKNVKVTTVDHLDDSLQAMVVQEQAKKLKLK